MAAPRAVPFLTVGFGTRPQRLRTAPGAATYKPPTTAQRQKAMSRLMVSATPGSPMAKEIPTERAPAGRPPTNLGKYLVKPIDDTTTGFEMLNDEPQVLTKVNEQFMRRGQLPPSLQPKYLRKPAVLDTNRAKNISKGWRDPRGRKG